MNTIREIEKINQQELELGIAGTSASWHTQFANSAWCYLGNIDHQLTEGDILCIMSQFGEIEDIHLVRNEETGKSRGFAFLKYEDSRSCILAVDNLCGVIVLGRSLRVDHVEQYRLPKKLQEQEESKTAGAEQKEINDGSAGHAYKDMELENNYNIHEGMDLFAPPPSSQNDNNSNKSKNMKDESNDEEHKKQDKLKRKEDRQKQREEKEQRKRRREEKREISEEKKRQKRSHKHRRRSKSDDDDGSGSDNDYGDGKKFNKRSERKSKDTIDDDDDDDNDTERRRKERKRHRSNHSSSRQEKTKHRSKNDKQDT
jgi:RNA-binding motif X-linked protein 2